MKATALVFDLIFGMKLVATAKSLGVTMSTVRSADEIEPADLLFVDLDVDDAIEAIRTAKNAADPPRVIAFGPHTMTDLLDAAREAGADEVVPRSAFAKRLPELLG